MDAKPVGEFYDADQIDNIRRDYPDWSLVLDAGRGFRRVVPSPEPLEVVERPVIESLLKKGAHHHGCSQNQADDQTTGQTQLPDYVSGRFSVDLGEKR